MTPRKVVERYLEVRPLAELLEALDLLDDETLKAMIGADLPKACGAKVYISVLRRSVW